MRTALERCEGLGREDLDLVWATDVEGRTIRAFMKARRLTTGITAEDERTC